MTKKHACLNDINESDRNFKFICYREKITITSKIIII